jgi:hypothetical protein
MNDHSDLKLDPECKFSQSKIHANQLTEVRETESNLSDASSHLESSTFKFNQLEDDQSHNLEEENKLNVPTDKPEQ